MEGKLHIAIGWDGAAVNAVALHSSRPLHASRLMPGKSLQAAVDNVPLLFSLCGRAQGVAAVMAAEAALEVGGSETLRTVRTRLVLCETIQEHLWRILIDWARLAGMQPGMHSMADIRIMIGHALKQQLAAGDWKTIGGKPNVEQGKAWLAFANALKDFLRDEVFGCEPEQWLEMETPERLENWCRGNTALAAQILNSLAQCERFGSSGVAAMPRPDEVWLRQAVQAMSEDAEFSQRPDWHGAALETGAWARQQRHPLLLSLAATNGNSVYARVVARLIELAQLLELVPTDCGSAAWSGSQSLDDGAGIAWVETARGLLMHRVASDGERIVAYQIVAPTEWNFHANGALVQGLRGMPAASKDEVRRRAEWLVQSLDPCVAYEITVHRA
ncbi:MAG TPA: nickel-dependent hydrogenase large subunit [Gallionella sp.]|nr:nickel-dependent hydrogenase large subunit [Gallionella sp.]